MNAPQSSHPAAPASLAVSSAGPADDSRIETFQLLAWKWNITAAKKATQGRTPVARIEPRDWAGMLRVIVINTEHAARVDMSEPLIVAPVPNGGMLIIDGWHRLYKALATDVEELRAVVLTAEEEHACRMHGGAKGDGYIR
ncbi:hypothetical protein GCM10009850_087640 [Nonomuraea monospora]|uniref:ParB/Sulfiredoxin domain-containing protein n=1 Tax=Nonomuraea monospora TaxID=568818 RepID=A0ABN3CV27_9ACTN